MRTTAHAMLVAAGLAACLLAPTRLGAADPPVKLITHPNRAAKLTARDVRAIYLKQKLFWDDGSPIIPINREAGSAARELFSQKIFGQGSRRSAGYWNQRYYEAGEFPPATLASQEAVIRFVASNQNAIGYVTGDDLKDDLVAVVLVLP
jgi:ABC-type phosphate transport system substrate-binding protein